MRAFQRVQAMHEANMRRIREELPPKSRKKKVVLTPPMDRIRGKKKR